MDEVTKPPHYTHGPLECRDAIESMLAGGGGGGVVDFYRAQIVQYIWRMPYKGNLLVDAKKADFYLRRMIKMLELSEHTEQG